MQTSAGEDLGHCRCCDGFLELVGESANIRDAKVQRKTEKKSIELGYSLKKHVKESAAGAEFN